MSGGRNGSMLLAKAIIIGPGALLAILLALLSPVVVAGFYVKCFWKPPKK
jgi:hypothetical protein